jgi:hypothetical protein
MLKNGASNWSIWSRKPPPVVLIRPAPSGAAANASTSIRSRGSGTMPDPPARRKSLNPSRVSLPPGKRSPTPTIAIGSCFSRSRLRSASRCRRTVSSASAS